MMATVASASERDRVCVLVAGRSGNGKSTALNNIFGLELPVGLSSRPVTSIFEQIKVKMNEVDLVVVDARGLRDLDESRMGVARDLAEAIKAEDYTLLYCLSAVTGCGLSEVDRTIVGNLQATLGSEVWRKCVLLLTFSDRVRLSHFSSESREAGYIVYLKTIAEDFQEILRDCGENSLSVQTVFEVDSKNRKNDGENVVAFPVGKYVGLSEEPSLLPGISDSGDWTERAFIEIARKTDERKRKALVGLKYGSIVASKAVSIAVGAGLEEGADSEDAEASESTDRLRSALSVNDIIAAIRHCRIRNSK